MSEYIAVGKQAWSIFVFHGNLMLCLTRDNGKSKSKNEMAG